MTHSLHVKHLRQNQTSPEKMIWSRLRNRQSGFKFRRQHPIDPYIVDFICLEHHLIVELDGSQHTDEHDKKRNDYLIRCGFRILRFGNEDILKNTEGVLQAIFLALNTPHPSPLPQGEREL